MNFRWSSNRPSPAMIVACLALFVALGGTSFAAVKLSKNSVGQREIKKNGVASSEVKNNSLTGADIVESKLGQVPSAASASNATNAANATNAGAVNGQRIIKINHKVAAASPDTVIFNENGLTITAKCPTALTSSLEATSGKEDSSIYTWVMGDGVPPAADPTQDDDEGGGFDTGDTFDLFNGQPANVNFAQFFWTDTSGNVVSGSLLSDEVGGTAGCELIGQIIVG